LRSGFVPPRARYSRVVVAASTDAGRPRPRRGFSVRSIGASRATSASTSSSAGFFGAAAPSSLSARSVACSTVGSLS